MNTSNLLTRPVTAFDFQSLMEPISAPEFFNTYWEKEPLIIHREQEAYFNELFSIETVDQVLDLHRPTGSSIRVVKNQEPLLSTKYENHDGSLNLNQLYASYADGYTIVINELQRYWQPLQVLCQNMSSFLSHHTVGNMYLTPKNQKALLPHYDTHDVFVIQVAGKKHWKIYDSPSPTPLLHSFQPVFQREQLQNMKDVTLYAGDMMYMPRGVPHEAFTTDDSSLHITIGVHPAQWLDLITNAMKQLAFSKIELRRALPQGYLNPESWTPEFIEEMQSHFKGMLESIAQEANVHGGVQMLAEEFRSQHSLRGDGHFAQIDQAEGLSLDVHLEKRQKMRCAVQDLGPFSRVVFPGNMIKGPSHISTALKFIAAAKGSFQLNELPGINDVNKIKLAARLIRGGLLKISE